MRRMLSALALMLLAAPAAAEDSPLRALATAEAARGWAAVGRLDIGGRGFCTGALIAPDLVLTAAHCLFDRDTGARVPEAALTFLAGLRGGRAEAHRGVRRAAVHPDYRPSGGERIDRVAADLALLELDHPIRLPSVRPYALAAEPDRGDRVGVVAYRQEREETPALQEACQVLGRQPGVLILSCAVGFGASGAPVFVREGGEARIASVVSAKAAMGDRPVALAAALGGRVAQLRDLLERGLPGAPAERLPQISASGVPEPAGPAAGAKFLRPPAR